MSASDRTGFRLFHAPIARDHHVGRFQIAMHDVAVVRCSHRVNLRDDRTDVVGEEFRQKEARFRKLWRARLAAQMVRLPEFEDVFGALQRTLRQAGLLG